MNDKSNIMKHIKLFEAYTIYNEMKKLINWKMVDDVKEMSLEYIDEGLSLYIGFIPILRNDTDNFFELYSIRYNHQQDEFRDGDDINLMCRYFTDMTGMSYFICLEGNMNKRDKHRLELELVNRVREAYPKEKINPNWT